MARYSQEHWDVTHQAILRETASNIRRHGPVTVSVAALMKSVGLTHGGFYAHFSSKEALIGDAIDWVFADRRQFLEALFAKYGAVDGFLRYIDHYLSIAHVENPEHGCPVPALSTDVGRLAVPLQERYFHGLESMLQLIAQHIPEALVRSAFSEMAGCIMLVRAFPHSQNAEPWLNDCKQSLRARVLHSSNVSE